MTSMRHGALPYGALLYKSARLRVFLFLLGGRLLLIPVDILYK
jgi:hypothetical protein